MCVCVSDCISTTSVQYQTEALFWIGERTSWWDKRWDSGWLLPGYINVTDRDFLFYWFVEAKDTRSNGNANPPVILWSNGGPGCTSMEGATTEIGPLLLKGVKTGDGYSGLKLDSLVKLGQTKSDFIWLLSPSQFFQYLSVFQLVLCFPWRTLVLKPLRLESSSSHYFCRPTAICWVFHWLRPFCPLFKRRCCRHSAIYPRLLNCHGLVEFSASQPDALWCLIFVVTVCYSMLQYVTVCYSMLQYVTVCYSMLQYVTVCYSMSFVVLVDFLWS